MSADFNRLAAIKIQMTALKREADAIQAEALAVENPAEKIVTPHGTLVLQKREEWKVLNNHYVFEVVGEPVFLSAASVSKANLAKVTDETTMDQLIEDGIIRKIKTTKYYKLNK